MVTKRRAQAIIELAIGVFAIVVVVSAITGFAIMIVDNLNAESSLRAVAGKDALNSFGGGNASISYRMAVMDNDNVHEKVFIPTTSGLN